MAFGPTCQSHITSEQLAQSLRHYLDVNCRSYTQHCYRSKTGRREPDLDDDLGVLVREAERAVEDLEILLEVHRRARQLLLVGVDVLVQLGRAVEERQATVVLYEDIHVHVQPPRRHACSISSTILLLALKRQARR